MLSDAVLALLTDMKSDAVSVASGVLLGLVAVKAVHFLRGAIGSGGRTYDSAEYSQAEYTASVGRKPVDWSKASNEEWAAHVESFRAGIEEAQRAEMAYEERGGWDGELARSEMAYEERGGWDGEMAREEMAEDAWRSRVEHSDFADTIPVGRH